MFSDLGVWKIVIIAVVVLIIFGGATKLPIFAKGLGQSVKVFRKEMKDVKDDVRSDRRADDPVVPEPVAVPADDRRATDGSTGSTRR